jgi:hypothetical protein
MSGNPAALQLRYLQTLLEVGSNQNSTIVLPVPIDLIKPLIQSVENGADRREQAKRRQEAREHERELDRVKAHELAAAEEAERTLAAAERGERELPAADAAGELTGDDSDPLPGEGNEQSG